MSVIWTEGIISAGKTTFSKLLAEYLNLRALFEPVDDNPLLDKFYTEMEERTINPELKKQPSRYAFAIQMYLMARRHAIQQLAAWEDRHHEYQGAVIDRGLPGDRVFCKLHVAEGNIEQGFWDVYEYFYDVMSLNMPTPSLVVFLDVDPRTAYERMRTRNRGCESKVPLDYLVKLHRGYLDLMAEIESGAHRWSRGLQVMRVPWNVDHQDTKPLFDEIAYRCRLKTNNK